MKVLSLCQPLASLCVIEHPIFKGHRGIKSWETRSFKPSKENQYIIRNEGMLIHASLSKEYIGLLSQHTLDLFKVRYDELPLGMIIGWVGIGRIIPTFDWIREPNLFPEQTEKDEERQFGNYSTGRWAWQLLTPVRFKTPIPIKGKLSLWNYNEPIPELSTTGKPILTPENK